MIAIYARQSIEKKDSVSIEAQIEKCKVFCEDSDYKIYKDAGYSGKNINRPQFTQLLQDIKSGLIKKVIAYRLDRISRSIADFSQLLLLFEKYNVKFVSATENFDTDTPMGRAMINIVMTFAQLERETIVERVTDSYYFRAKNGYWAGGYAPYGYKIKHIIGQDGKKHSILDINQDQAKIVKEIYDMYINKNISMRKISQDLNLRKIPPQREFGPDSKWTLNTIKAVLTRPIYTNATAKIYNYFNELDTQITNDIEMFDGSFTANLFGKTKKTVRAKAVRDYNDMYLSIIRCPAIISNDDWFKAQAIKGKREHLAPRTNTSNVSFLCGLVKCGKCGSNFVTQGCKNKYGIKYHYLICCTKRNVGASVCNNKMIEINKLQDYVINDMKEYFNSTNIDNKIKKYVTKKNKTNSQVIAEKEEYENQITKYNIQIQNLIDSIAEGNSIAIKYINQKIEVLEKQKNDISIKLQKLNNNNYLEEDNYIVEYIKYINEKLNTSDFVELETICKTVIDKIIITDENIDIHYKI